MQYFGFIFASYAITALVLGALIAWVILDHRGRRAELAALEAQGVRRRSDRVSKSGR
jgi:heme exporter protein D